LLIKGKLPGPHLRKKQNWTGTSGRYL